jgi:hypothetical protein
MQYNRKELIEEILKEVSLEEKVNILFELATIKDSDLISWYFNFKEKNDGKK